jgi:hypothetical protein
MILQRTVGELEELPRGFETKSTEQVMSGCVGALDGLLLIIRAPSKKEASNERQFFSGHSQQICNSCMQES